MPIKMVFIPVLVGCFACACGDDDGGARADGGPRDSTVDRRPKDGLPPEFVKYDGPIAKIDGLPLPSNFGEPCTKATEKTACKPGSPTCIENICTVSCATKDCPDETKQVCATVEVNGIDTDLCLLRCSPNPTSNPCPKGSDTACTPESAYYTGELDVAVCWDSPCSDGKDCPVSVGTTCKPANGDKDCKTGEFCFAITTNAGKCAVAGNCSTATGLCHPHTLGKSTAKVGDPCKSDKDCGNAMFCEMEDLDTSTGLTTARNGYCSVAGCAFEKTLTFAACPTGSACNRAYYGGLCQKTCDLSDAKTCRGLTGDYLGDYECYAWNNITQNSVALADKPVCDIAPYTPCDLYKSDKLECKAFGLKGNTTTMACRNPKTGAVLTDAYDPKGLCLDTTASGPVKP